MPDHDHLLELLQDRKSSTKTGRASLRMAICLEADLSADLEDAELELAAVKEAAAVAAASEPARAGGKVPIDPEMQKRVDAAEKAVAAAVKAADAASVFITFTALRAHDYDALLKEHPPRDGNDVDKLRDFNSETFPDALMAASASKKIEDVEGKPVAMDIEDIITEMSNGERAVGCQTALEVNGRTSSFFEAKSQSRQRSGSSSKRR